MKAILTCACVAIALTLLPGCGLGGGDDLPATVDAQGVLTLDGQTIGGASIVFVPVDGDRGAQARSDSSGKFALKAFEAKEGAVPGQYQVMVSRTVEVGEGQVPTAEQLGEDAEHMTEEEKAGVRWVNDLPKKYANPKDSGIVIDIPTTGDTNIQIRLESN